MLSRLEALEKGAVSTKLNQLRSEFSQQIATLKTDVEIMHNDFKAEVDMFHREIKTDVEEMRMDFNELKTTMDATTALVGALAIDQKTTRHLLTNDQIESRRCMQEAVTKIEVSVSAGCPPVSTSNTSITAPSKPSYSFGSAMPR